MLAAVPLVVIAHFSIILSVGNAQYLPNVFLDLLWGSIVATILILLRFQASGIVVRILEHPVFLYLGTISYSLYLVHAVLIAILTRYLLYPLALTPNVTFLLLAGIGVPCSIIVAHIFYIMFERPFVRGFSLSHLQKFYSEPISLRITIDKDVSAQ